jgi:hypothetical protein
LKRIRKIQTIDVFDWHLILETQGHQEQPKFDAISGNTAGDGRKAEQRNG